MFTKYYDYLEHQSTVSVRKKAIQPLNGLVNKVHMSVPGHVSFLFEQQIVLRQLTTTQQHCINALQWFAVSRKWWPFCSLYYEGFVTY